jgi:hypothetical protein
LQYGGVAGEPEASASVSNEEADRFDRSHGNVN